MILPGRLSSQPFIPTAVLATNTPAATLVSPLNFLISNILRGDNITIDLTNHAGKLSAIRIHATAGSGDAGGTNSRQGGTLTLTNLANNPNVATNILGSGSITVTSNNLGEWTISATAADAGGTNARQFGSAVLSNLVLTVANNITNFVSLSTSNATSKPLTNSYANGVVRIFGLEPGTGMSLSVNASNIVITSTVDAGGTNSRQFGTLVLTNLSSTGAITNLNDTQFVDEGAIATIKTGAFQTNMNFWGEGTNHGGMYIGDKLFSNDKKSIEDGGADLLVGSDEWDQIIFYSGIGIGNSIVWDGGASPNARFYGDLAVAPVDLGFVVSPWNNYWGSMGHFLVSTGFVETTLLKISNSPGLDRQILFWHTNGQGYTAFSAPTNAWNPTNRFFLTITNPVAGQVLKILNVSYANGVASIVLTNDADSTGSSSLTTNANQFGPSVQLTLKDGLKITNAASFGTITNFGALAMIPETPDTTSLGTISTWYGDVFLDRLRLVDQNASGFDIQLQAPTLGASWQLFLPDTLAIGALTNDGAGQSGWYDLANISGDAGGTNARQFGTLSLTNLSGNPNVATNILGAGSTTVTSNNLGQWTISSPAPGDPGGTNGRQFGSAVLSNLVGTVGNNVTNVVSLSTTNATSKPLTNSYTGGVLTLYGLEAGSGASLSVNGSNIVISATGSGDAGGTNARQFGALTLTNLSNNPNVATNIIGAGFTLVSSNNAGEWTITGLQSGETNYNGEISITNATRFGLVAGKSAVTNLLRSIAARFGLVGTNEGGTNISFAIDPAIVASQANITALSNAIVALVGETNWNGEVSVTNGTRIGWVYGKAANTNLLRSVQGGNGVVLTNEGTNVMVAIDPAVVATVAWANSISNLAQTKQHGAALLTNLVNNPYTGYTNQVFGGTNISVRTSGGTNFIDTIGHLNNWSQIPTGEMANVVSTTFLTNWANSISNLAQTKQNGSAVLTNLVGTVGKNVTNVVSLSTSNATSKPLTNSYASGVLTLYGLQAAGTASLSVNESNIVISASAGAADSLWSSNDITLFPGMYTNRVAIGTNQTQPGVGLYVVGYSQSFPGAQTFENYAQGSGSEANGLTVMMKPDTGYAGSQSYTIQARNDTENHGGTLAALTGDVASYGVDSLNTAPGSGSQVKGATVGVQGYSFSINSVNIGVSGVAGPATATSTNIALAGVAVANTSYANTKDIGIYGAFKTTGEITTPAKIERKAVALFDGWTSNVPLLVLQTNNGNIVVYVDNAGSLIATNTIFARVSMASPTLSVTNFPGLDRQLTLWHTNGQGYTAFSGPTNTWNPTNRFFLTITNPIAGQVLKMLSVSYDSGVASIVLTNDTDLNPTLTSNANQLAGVPLSIKESALLTNTIHYSSDTNRTNISINQRIGQLVPMLSVRGSNDAPLVEIDNAGYILQTNNLTARAATPTNTIALGAEDYGGLTFPTWTEGHGLEFNVQAALFNTRFYMLLPSSGTTVGTLGTATVNTGGTTISHTTPDELQPSMIQVASATSSNSTAGVAMTNNLANAGAHDGSSRMAGYFYSCEWSITNFIAGIVGGGAPRFFVGLANAASPDLTNIVQTTNATGQYIGLMGDPKQSLNMFITARDGSAEFRTNTGINIVCTNIYQFSMFNAHTSRFVGWRLKSMTDATEAKGWFSNNVPTNFMKGVIMTKNGTNRANDIRFSKMYLQAPLAPN